VKDRYGNDLTTTSEAARDAYVAGVDHILAATWGARDAFEAAIEADRISHWPISAVAGPPCTMAIWRWPVRRSTGRLSSQQA
jgi:hypothetical protein